MTQVIEKPKAIAPRHQYQYIADVLNIDPALIEDVWIEEGNVLFIDLPSCNYCINHTGDFSDNHGTKVYSNVEVTGVELFDMHGEPVPCHVPYTLAQEILETFLESSDKFWDEYSWEESLQNDAEWDATCAETKRWLEWG